VHRMTGRKIQGLTVRDAAPGFVVEVNPIGRPWPRCPVFVRSDEP